MEAPPLAAEETENAVIVRTFYRYRAAQDESVTRTYRAF
ncbi:MAG: hypothetical protein J07HQX50_00673 [Haloquadratum sp. J07HQX50]|nr:MAG: hypothetical protein J07HQX50_00673 [Haloquadratum sp. J07HQX50]